MMVRLYYSERSPNCRKVHLGLLEVGADYQLVHVDIAAREQKRPELLALNPNGQVPILIDGDFVLWESNAILWYLAEKYPATQLLPDDRLERARIQQMLFWQATALGPAVKAAARGAAQTPPDNAMAPAEAMRMLGILGELLDGDRSLVGSGTTIADLAAGPSVERAVDLGLEIPEGIGPWLKAMRARPSWVKVFGARTAR